MIMEKLQSLVASIRSTIFHQPEPFSRPRRCPVRMYNKEAPDKLQLDLRFGWYAENLHNDGDYHGEEEVDLDSNII